MLDFNPSKLKITLFACLLLCLTSIFFTLKNFHSNKNISNEIQHTKQTEKTAPQNLSNHALTKNIQPSININAPLYDGTNILGKLNTDKQNNFIADKDTILLFNYFFLAYDGNNKNEIVSNITQYIDKNLSDPANKQALNFLKKYLLYKDATFDLFKTKNLSLTQLTQNPTNIATQIFGESQAEYLFNLSEKKAALSRLEIVSNKALDLEKKQKQLQQAYQTLPESTKRFFTSSEQLHQFQKAYTKAKSVEAREKLILSFWETDSANRFYLLEQERKQWQHRLEDFSDRRQKIINNQTLNSEQKENAIEQLKTRLFSDREIRRVDVFEKMKRIKP